MEPLLTPKEVAKMLGMSPQYVRDHACPPPGKKKRNVFPLIPVVRLGSSHRAELRFRKQDILKFIEDNLVGGTESGRL